MRRVWVVGLILAVGVLWIGTASVRAEGGITLWTALSQEDLTVMEELVRGDGGSGQPPVTVRNFSSEEELLHALRTGMPAPGGLPDLALIDTRWQAVLEPALVPVEDLMNQVGTTLKVVAKMDTFGSVYQRAVRNGRLLTLPFSVDAYALLYHEGLLSQTGVKRPATWAELQRTAKVIAAKRPGISGFVLPVEQGVESLGELWSSMVQSAGGGALEIGVSASNPSGGLLSRLAVSTLQSLWDLVNKEKAASVTEGGGPEVVARQAGMTVGDVRYLETLRRIDRRWNATLLPKGKTRPAILQVWSLAIFRKPGLTGSDLFGSYGAAWNLAHHLTEFPQAKEWALKTAHLPVNKQVYLSPYYISMLKKEKPWLRTYIQLVALPSSPSILPDEEGAYQILGREILAALKRERGVQEALTRAVEALTRRVRERGMIPWTETLKAAVGAIPGRVGIALKRLGGGLDFFRGATSRSRPPA